MELESQTGSKIKLKTETKLGRNTLSQKSLDKTISRHHITLNPNTQKRILNLVVYGKNPIWVLDENGEIKVYRRGDKGEMKVGDAFCVGSFKDSFEWFYLREVGDGDDLRKMEELGVDFDEIGSVGGESETLGSGGDDVSDVVDDPVQEFGFVVMGHEFDNYPKKMIRDIRNWDWFLEEHKEEDSDEDEDEDEVGNRKAKKGKRRKRKKGTANDDEDDDVWTGESEEDTELIKKLKNDPKPKYTTRSKDQKKSKKGAGASKSGKNTTKSSAMDVDVEDDEDEDEADETLGGFIVDDEDVGEEIDEDVDEKTDEDDEDEEFEEDEDDE